MSDHLYPARPGMLRRGTPVTHRADTARAVVVGLDGDGDAILASMEGGFGWAPPDAARLDLRDVTARAHAAMPYTVTGSTGQYDGRACETSCIIREQHLFGQHAATLCRMRCLDERVTAEEARAALDCFVGSASSS